MCASFGAFNDNWRQAKYGKVINRYSCTYAPLGFWLSVATRKCIQSLLLANINLHAYTMYCMERIFHFRDSSKSFAKVFLTSGKLCIFVFCVKPFQQISFCDFILPCIFFYVHFFKKIYLCSVFNFTSSQKLC